MTDETRRELEAIKSELYRLSYRVRALGEQLTRESREPDVGATPRVRPELTTETRIRPEPETVPAGANPQVRPYFTPPPPPATPLDEEAQSFDRVLGGKVALYTGLTLLFLATAFFLGWAWTQLSPAGRLTLGYVGGALLMGLGVVARERTERWFSDGLMGAGLATLYLTTWAGWERYALLSYAGAFGLTGAITALGVALALWRGSETLAIVATLGGFSAPVWLRGDGGGAPTNFFGYLAALNAGMLAVSAWREWRYHQLTCLVATIALLNGWAMTSYAPEYRRLTLGFVSLYYALFSAAYLLGFLQMPYRALSFAGLGLALIGVAWLYSRFGTVEPRAN
jgi:Predicted membrane protein